VDRTAPLDLVLQVHEGEDAGARVGGHEETELGALLEEPRPIRAGGLAEGLEVRGLLVEVIALRTRIN
jgi:hypothetical protein